MKGAASFVPPLPGSTITVDDATYTYVSGVGYVLGDVKHVDGRLTTLQVRIAENAEILAASSTAMHIRGTKNTAVVEFVPSRGHLRVDRVTVTPFTESDRVLAYLVPTVYVYGPDSKLEVEHILGRSMQYHLRYINGLLIERTVTHRDISAPKVLQLHADVTYSRDVYTLTIPGGRVQASPVGQPIDPDAVFGRLKIKGHVYKFTWGGSSRKFHMEGDLLKDPARVTPSRINSMVTRFSDGSYELATPDGLVRYDANHRATLKGKSIPGTINFDFYKYIFTWLDKSKTFRPDRDANGLPTMIAAD